MIFVIIINISTKKKCELSFYFTLFFDYYLRNLTIPVVTQTE